MDGRPVDPIPVVVEGEPVCQRNLHGRILPTSAAGCSGTVDRVSRLGIMLGIAVPLAAADLLVKANAPTDAWAYHERSYGWLVLSAILAPRSGRCHPHSVARRGVGRGRPRGRPPRQQPLRGVERHVGSQPARDRRRPQRDRLQPRGHLGARRHPAPRSDDRLLADPQPGSASPPRPTSARPAAGRSAACSIDSPRTWTFARHQRGRFEYHGIPCR